MIRIRQMQGGLHRDRTGGAAIEFALIAPTLLLLLFVVLDLGHMAYSSAILNGAVQEASRSAALETGSTAEADGFVRSSMQTIVPGASVTGSRTSYYDFSDVGRAERWNDANGNGACDNGEAYTDENRSGSWEADVGRNGNGGANDVVVYRVTVRYVPVFQIPFLPESWAARQMNAAAVRKNQPFSSQAGYGSAAGTCS